jgi:4-amino-4-deoxy-L-arabinose transferase-like glycosyltransferase
MFMDGLYYATIGRNMSIGLGDFWHPYFTATNNAEFYGHPPLAFGLQSILFSIFGDQYWVERVYSLLTYLITTLIIFKTWRIIQTDYKSSFWIPLFFWLIMPMAYWGISNNMLENSLMVFSSLTVLLAWKYKNTEKYHLALLSGISLSLAFLCKGFVGLFPLSIALWFFIFFKDFNLTKGSKLLLLQLIGLTIPFLILYFTNKEAIESIITYIKLQVFGSLVNEVYKGSRFFVLYKLFMEILPLIILSSIILFMQKKKSLLKNNPNTWIFFSLGLSAVVPMIISKKQGAFYIIPALPLFGLGFAALLKPIIINWTNKLDLRHNKYKVFKVISILFFIVGIALNIFQIGRIGRDKSRIEDIHQMIEIIPERATISIDPKLQTEYSLYGYFMRKGLISLDPKSLNHEYYLTTKKSKNHPKHPQKLLMTNNKYQLYGR